MKKLMIVASVALAASFANAAASAWWSSGDTYYNGVGSALNGADGGTYEYSGTGYLFLLTAAQAGTFTDAKSIWDNFNANGGSLKIGDATIAGVDYAYTDGYADWGDMGDLTANQYAAIIMTHETEGVVDAYSANTMYAVVSELGATGPDVAALGWGEAAGGTATTWQAAAVPEPTSGLLLLLGVAGLALRRRRA